MSEYLNALDESNRTRIKELLGDQYDFFEVDDYVGYFSPDRLMTELDILERKLKYFQGKIPGDKPGTFVEPKVSPEAVKDLQKAFKEHLRYLCTNFEADKRAVT